MQGQVEQPRVLLVAVPYALKAADADTIEGKPASAFVLAAPAGSFPSNGSTSSSTNTLVSVQGASGVTAPAISGSGTRGHIAGWTSSTNLGNSTIVQNLAGNIGKGTISIPSCLERRKTRPSNGRDTPCG